MATFYFIRWDGTKEQHDDRDVALAAMFNEACKVVAGGYGTPQPTNYRVILFTESPGGEEEMAGHVELSHGDHVRWPNLRSTSPASFPVAGELIELSPAEGALVMKHRLSRLPSI